MRKVFFLLVIHSCMNAHGQNTANEKRLNTSQVNVSFVFSNAQPKDSADFYLRIVYTNKGNKTDSVYSTLKDGYIGDEDYNFNIHFEKLNGKQYKLYNLYNYNKINSNDDKPFYRCLDLPKKPIRPLTSDTLAYNLLRSGKFFEEGKYRFKAYVRTKCSFEKGRGTDLSPIDPEIEYAESKWIYFELKKPIYSRVKVEI